MERAAAHALFRRRKAAWRRIHRLAMVLDLSHLMGDFDIPVQEVKETTVYVENLADDVTDTQLYQYFISVGTVKKAFVARQRGKDAQDSLGFGYVTFASGADADRAIAQLHGSDVSGNKIKVTLAAAKKTANNAAKTRNATDPCAVLVSGLPSQGLDKKKVYKRMKKIGSVAHIVFPGPESLAEAVTARVVFHKPADAARAVEDLNDRVFKGQTLRVSALHKKAARVIVRNIPFEVEKDDLKALLAPFGHVGKIEIPSQGYAFVQMASVLQAANAVDQLAESATVKGRPVAVDWAIAKPKFEAVAAELADKQQEEEETREPRTRSGASKDIAEKRTLFVRNIPTLCSEEEVRAVFEAAGLSVKKVSLVVHTTPGETTSTVSKGVAFIQFRDPEEADRALQLAEDAKMAVPERFAGDEMMTALMLEGIAGFLLRGKMLELSRARSREDVDALRAARETVEVVDKRHLYLAREGLVMPGAEAAEGTSKEYMEHRMYLWKQTKEKLGNANYVVSRVRLTIHNLPLKFTDKELKELFVGAVDSAKAVKQAVVVRDRQRVAEGGVGRSKKFGFVEFSRHEDALAALRKVNNNPGIFTAKERPIVAFALDDMRELHKRKQRREFNNIGGADKKKPRK